MKVKSIFMAAIVAFLMIGSAVAQASEKTIIIYYSWSGNTKKIANLIQQKTNADLFELTLEEPAPSNYNDCLNMAQQAQKSNARPKIKEPLPNINDYDIVILAYPLWWGDIPMHFYTLLDKIDLSGKTVLPICSNGGSGLVRSVGSIKKLEPKANVKNGLSITNDGGSKLEKTVSDYLKKNNL
ncbi:flavodoxin [Treponema zioleckii]|uniref:flavodoxin n=1 Tax=Treponema zioleckii TaxID=331680 RepID=UPI00168A9805|nr:flavodoxin [Treponema zioleckii]